MKRIIGALILVIMLSVSLSLMSVSTLASPNSPTVILSNTAYLNGTETYYTNTGQTSAGSITYYSQPNYYLNSTAIFAGSVGTTKSLNSADNIYLGTYQYVAYSGLGNGLISSSYAETPDMAIAFEAGVATIASGSIVTYDYNVGTIYATLTMVNVSSGSQVQSSWQYTMDAEWSYPGSSGVIFSPEWFPDAPGGTYYFYIYVGVTPYQNYNGQLPSNAETTSNSGYQIDNYQVSYPSAPSYVYFEDGWTYNGLTYSGLPVLDYSASFTPSFPQTTAAIEISFSSPFSVEMYVITSDGNVNTFQENSGSLTFSTYLPEGCYFENIYGDPNVPQFSINWYAENAIIPGTQSLNLISTGNIAENGNWFNSTGGNSYQFQFSTTSGALNGQIVDGIQWNTTVSYTASHLIDYGYGVPLNIFSVNGKTVSSPKLYNALAGNLNDNNLESTVSIDISTENLVNYIPSMDSASISTQSTVITENVNFTMKVSDVIQNEANFISINWGDGTSEVTMPTTNSTILVNHTFYSPGSYTPTVTISNQPNAATGSLSSKIYNLPSVSISSIQAFGKVNTSEVNPRQAVDFNITVPPASYPSSDGLVLSFGDGSTYTPPSFGNFSVSYSYSELGTFDPLLEITAHRKLVVEEVNIRPILVVPISTIFENGENNMVEHLMLNYSSLSPLKEVKLYLNGSLAKIFPNQGDRGNLYYNFTTDQKQKNLASWNLTTIYWYSMNVSEYFVQEFKPVITSLTSSAEPSLAGKTVLFSYSINWGDDTGTTAIKINGQIISGDSYNFTEPGTYNVTLVASNSQGSAEYSITENIGNKPSINYLWSNLSSTLVGKSVEFNTNITWNDGNGNFSWLINGKTILKNENCLNYTFTSSGTFNVSVMASNIFGGSERSMNEHIQTGVPKVLNAYSWPEPIYAGNFSYFSADVNWSDDVGAINWAVNGQNITGNTFEFVSAGNYSVTATAVNSYGTSSMNFTLKVLPANSSGTVIPTPTNSTKQNTPPNNNLLYGVIGGTALISVVAVFFGYFVLMRKRLK
ncbi:MAG: hypothetical protein QXU18_06470 [Thermoplasmatales archaeon]